MIHLGDITKINGAEIEPVDCVTAGSPCQDLSVAGKRAGLDGERSGLFMEQIRIIKEMRKADENRGRTAEFIRPRYMVWENVPGALSSNKGEDFRCVLEETARIAQEDAVIPESPKEGWHYSGAIMGDGWSIAWRIHDAQFWGVPQRRKRIALVADFGGGSASEILFVRKSLSRDSEPSKQKKEETAGAVGNGVKSADLYDAYQHHGWRESDTCGTITIGQNNCVRGDTPLVLRRLALAIHEADGQDITIQENTAYALVTGGGKPGQGFPCVLTIDETKNRSAVCYGISSYNSNAMLSDNPHSGIYEADTSRTLDLNGGSPACNQGGMAVVESIVCIEGNGSRPSHRGDGFAESETMYTLNSTEHHAVATYQKVCGTVDCGIAKGTGNQLANQDMFVADGYNVRRLTPMECERLQGFPDGWTDIGEWIDTKGKVRQTSDSARYKALGNSIALPFWFYLLRRISAQYERPATLGSLFDGIGGFPLCWERCNGPGTARWASEIEEFPIAVTKRHFGED